MKILLILFCIFFCSGCANEAKDDRKTFVPGTYIRFSEHEFGKEWDTLTVTEQNPAANQYRIERRWRYERVLDGQVLEPEYKVTSTSGIFDADKNAIVEQPSGKLHTFDEIQGSLFAGKVEYRKLK